MAPETEEGMDHKPASAGDSVAAPLPGRTAARGKATWGRWGAVAAAVLVIVSALSWMAWPRESPARLLAVGDARWGAGVAPAKVGERLPTRPLVLESGHIKIGFENGNSAIIEGPARFAVSGELAVTLERGALTAVVGEAGRGLRVSTPAAQVTDLGTEFGVLASAATTRVVVFNGKVVVNDHRAGAGARELAQGDAVEVSAAGIHAVPYEPAAFRRFMAPELRALDLVDLLAGSDGAGSASGAGIDAATGGTRQTRAVTLRRGDRRYVRVNDHAALDGCFIPGGRMPVDSAGHLFTFPPTSLMSYGLIWAGPDVPWEGDLPISTTLPAEGAGPPTARVLVMHSNNGVTLNLERIRALHAPATITGFRARVGNSYRAPGPGAAPARPLASVHLIVDGVARFERRSFANVEAPFEVACSLSEGDRFLTLATTEGGDGSACDWVLWTRPELVLAPPK